MRSIKALTTEGLRTTQNYLSAIRCTHVLLRTETLIILARAALLRLRDPFAEAPVKLRLQKPKHKRVNPENLPTATIILRPETAILKAKALLPKAKAHHPTVDQAEEDKQPSIFRIQFYHI